MGAAALSVISIPRVIPPTKTISSRKGASLRTASSSSGRFGSAINFLAEQFDSEVSLTRSTATNRIAERENTIKLGISQSCFRRALVERRERNSSYFSINKRPHFRRIAVIQKA